MTSKISPPPKTSRLHPRNRHQGRYDFPALLRHSPELAPFVILNPYGKQSIDFANPEAVRVFNRALLRQFYGLQHWDIPPGYLCPPIPGRADYIHHLADLLAQDCASQIPTGAQWRFLDIGTGANCIYPLLGQREYGWSFIGAEVDDQALQWGQQLLRANGLHKAIQLRRQQRPQRVLHGIIQAGEQFAASLCNPPFHASEAEAQNGSRRKWRNLGKQDPQRQRAALNFGGRHHELWCPGGEVGFLRRLIQESHDFCHQVAWFTTLVSKGGNVAPLRKQLERLGAQEIQVIDMGQGQKISRLLAWSFLPQAARVAHLAAGHPIP